MMTMWTLCTSCDGTGNMPLHRQKCGGGGVDGWCTCVPIDMCCPWCDGEGYTEDWSEYEAEW
jgi:DnaJ-class molecular chaperone